MAVCGFCHVDPSVSTRNNQPICGECLNFAVALVDIPQAQSEVISLVEHCLAMPLPIDTTKTQLLYRAGRSVDDSEDAVLFQDRHASAAEALYWALWMVRRYNQLITTTVPVAALPETIMRHVNAALDKAEKGAANA